MNIILALTGIACALGILIFIASKVLPEESDDVKKTEDVSAALPGMNCGACGYPGCFAYAQALTADPSIISSNPCPVAIQNPDRIKAIEAALNITIDSAAMAQKAVVHCSGNSQTIFTNSGTSSCKAAALRLSGYRTCPFACLGFGDCVEVCPQNAISINPDKNVAFIDWDGCVGCGLCISECPQNIIELIPANTKIAHLCSYTPLKNIPGRIRCDSGCTHCKKCFRACEYNAIIWNTEKLIPEFNPDKCTLCLKCIEACPTNCLALTVQKEDAGVS
ncbi:MAG: 4Fe-4S binding protein [Dehalococcoidia bacterium]|nr:4Fe-4S binding protein [Dehalococcoidia bacterium]